MNQHEFNVHLTFNLIEWQYSQYSGILIQNKNNSQDLYFMKLLKIADLNLRDNLLFLPPPTPPFWEPNLGLGRIVFWPDTGYRISGWLLMPDIRYPAGYPASTGYPADYRISGRITGYCGKNKKFVTKFLAQSCIML